MKKLGIWAVLGVGALVLGVYFGNAVSAQATRAAAAPKSRVAILNLKVVLKKYGKFVALTELVKNTDNKYVEQLKAKQTRVEGLQTEYKGEKVTAQRKEQIESEAKMIKFEMEDIKQKWQKEVNKVQEEQLGNIYREVDQVVRQYAADSGIDLVFRYAEDWDDDYSSPAKIVGRLQMPIWPMYYEKTLEITYPVIEVLNRKFGGGQAAAPAGGVIQTSGSTK